MFGSGNAFILFPFKYFVGTSFIQCFQSIVAWLIMRIQIKFAQQLFAQILTLLTRSLEHMLVLAMRNLFNNAFLPSFEIMIVVRAKKNVAQVDLILHCPLVCA